MAVIFLIACGVICLFVDLVVWLVKIAKDANPNGEMNPPQKQESKKKIEKMSDVELDVVDVEELYED